MAIVLSSAPALAQTIGTFRWQLQPYCNVVTVTVVFNGGGYTLDGFDDQCGGAQRAAAAGTAFLNPDGSIGIGLAIVTAPTGMPVHVDVALNLATLNGTWRDSASGSGAFVFTPGAGIGGTPRPAPGAIFTSGLVAGQTTFLADGSFVARGTSGVGAVPAAGGGSRAMWFAGRGAFRAGSVREEAWDDAVLGVDSAAFGRDTIASGRYSFAAGMNSFAGAEGATALGGSYAGGTYSTAAGAESEASGAGSIAMGQGAGAYGTASVALGYAAFAGEDYSVAIGATANSQGRGSVALGLSTTATGRASTSLGEESTASGAGSLAAGLNVTASGDYSVALGHNVSTASHAGSFIFGDNANVANTVATGNNQFVVRATGGVRFLMSANLANACEISGASANLFCSGTITGSSDRHRKQDITPLNGEDVLKKVAAMPVTTWSFIEEPSVRHAGPMAQDFRAAFGLGDNDTSISYTDINGINMRAIQALERRTSDLQIRNEALERENAAFRTELEAIRAQLTQLLGLVPVEPRRARER